MARNDKNKNKPADTGDEEREAPDFAGMVQGEDSPEGFRRVNPLDSATRLYFKPDVGAVLQGVLLGRFQRSDGEEGEEERFYFQVRVTKDCEHCTNGDGDKVTAEFGMVVQLDERSGLRDLVPYADKKERQEIFVRSKEKVKVKGSARTFWRWDVFAKKATAATLGKLADYVKKEESESSDFGAPE